MQKQPKNKKLQHILQKETGMATAEYAIVTLAAAGFAGLLAIILRSEEVRNFLMNIIHNALSLS